MRGAADVRHGIFEVLSVRPAGEGCGGETRVLLPYRVVMILLPDGELNVISTAELSKACGGAMPLGAKRAMCVWNPSRNGPSFPASMVTVDAGV